MLQKTRILWGKASRFLLKLLLSTFFFAFVFDLGFFAANLVSGAKDISTLSKADVIVVLSGGRGRLREGIKLLEEGVGDILFFSGTSPDSSLDSILRANDLEKLEDYLRKRIRLGSVAQTTPENTFEIRNLVQESGARKIILVTSNYHMPRALKLLSAELARDPILEVMIDTYPVESPNFKEKRWWLSFTSWRLLFEEYFKSLPYRFEA